MKRVKILALCLSMSILAGCGNDASKDVEPVDYPVLEAVKLDEMELKTAEGGDMKYQYDSTVWAQDEAVFNSLVVYQKDTMETELPVSLNAQMAGKFKGNLTEEFMQESLDMLEKNASITVDACEMRSFNGTPIVCLETTTVFTDAVIDKMIETEQWTEEMVEEAGGREAVLAIPDSRAIVVYGVAEGQLVVYGGTYYTEDQKQMVADAVNVMLQTTEIK